MVGGGGNGGVQGRKLHRGEGQIGGDDSYGWHKLLRKVKLMQWQKHLR